MCCSAVPLQFGNFPRVFPHEPGIEAGCGYAGFEQHTRYVPPLTEDEIAGLIGYAREKFAAEKYPFVPALRPIREVLAKLDRAGTRAPAATEAVRAELVLTKKNKRRR